MPKDAPFRLPRAYARFRRVFFIFLASYMLMLMLPSAGILYLYREVVQMTERNSARNAMTAVDDVGDALRAELLWMDNAAAKLLLNTDMISMLYADPLSYADTRVGAFSAFSERLNDLIGAYDTDFLGFRLLFQDSELVFYDNAIAHGLRFFYRSSLQYEGMPYEIWNEMVFSPERKSVLPAHDIHLGKTLVRALTYNYPIVRRSPQGTRKAVLQFFIPEENLVLESFDPQSTGYLIDENGTVLSVFGAAPQITPDPAAFTEAAGWLRIDGGLLAYTRINSDLTLAIHIPERVAFQDALAMRKPLAGLFLFFAIVEGLFSLYLARRNARPIENLASDMSAVLNEPRSSNELIYLNRGLQRLRQDRQSAQDAFLRTKQAQTELLLQRLFANRFEDESAVLLEGERLGVDLRAQSFAVAVAPASAQSAPMPPFPQGLRNVRGGVSGGVMSLLYLCESPAGADASALILAHVREFAQGLPEDACIGLGRVCSLLTDASLSYTQALYCLQADVPVSGVQQFDQLSLSFNSLRFPLDQQQRILNAVKHANLSVIDQEFAVLREENTVKRHLSAPLKRTLLSSVEALLLTAAEETAQKANLSDYLRSIHRVNDLRAELDILCQEFKKLAQNALERHFDHSSAQRDSFVAYLEAHYSDPALSIGSVSNHFGFSESYFSVLFKELTGETYSAYLEALRITHAKELLRGGSVSVEEIAQRVGYNNSTTFRRAFKRLMGISPLQFHQQEKL